MTRQEKKTAERAALEALLLGLGVAPSKIEPGETPDFMLSIDERLVGVEMTTFQSNVLMDSNPGRHQVEAAHSLTR